MIVRTIKENYRQMNYWIEEIERTPHVHIKMLRYRPDINHSIDVGAFSSDEKARYNSYKSRKRKLEFYFTRMLWESFEIKEEIKYKASGKPVIQSGYVSISHSHDCIAIAFAKQNEIGLDIEPVSEKIKRVKHKFSHPDEQFEDLLDLTKSWCIKEAVYKLLDLYDIIFMENILVENVSSPANTKVELEGEVIRSRAKVLELPNDMIMAYTLVS